MYKTQCMINCMKLNLLEDDVGICQLANPRPNILSQKPRPRI